MKEKQIAGQELGPFQLKESQISSELAGSLALQTTASTHPAVIEWPEAGSLATLRCMGCGQIFERLKKEHTRAFRRYGSRNNVNIFCSKRCSQPISLVKQKICPQCNGPKAVAAQVCGACYLADKVTTLSCDQCGTSFRRPNSEIRKAESMRANKHAFCSVSCYRQHKKENPAPLPAISGECPACKQPVVAGKKFCSTTCYRSRLSGEAEIPYSKGWNQEAHRTRKRYSNTCAHCGRAHPRTAVHHIDHISTNHEPENLILLCEPCHNNYHQRTTEEVREILKTYFLAKATGSATYKLELEISIVKES